jgi:hypothetical protein
MEGFIDDSQTGNVNSATASALQRAINDETAQMQNKLAERAQRVADKYNA